MCAKWTKWAAAALLSTTATSPALAGSVTRPGDTLGAAMGRPVPPGLYLANGATYECRNGKTKDEKDVCAFVDVPILAWSTPWKVSGARLQLATAPIVPVRVRVHDTLTSSSLFNPFFGAQLAWDLGNDWGVSYLLGTYVKTSGERAYSSTSLNQRFAVSYTGDGWNLSTTAILGTHFDKVTSKPQGSPCPVTAEHPRNGCNPDFLNVDVTATKRFDKWELGAVGVYSTDLNKPIREYEKQSQVQIGGLVAYYFERAVVQAYVTTNVYDHNYGGPITSGTLRLVVPLGAGPPIPIAP